MKLSIVTTLYQSASYIKEFYQRVTHAARQVAGEDFEIVFVNDGSPDVSLELAVQLFETDSHVVVIDLSRNFGHHKAMMTGLVHSQGQFVFLIDSDLEEEPECLISFVQQMQNDACDVVYGVQESRKGGWFERLSGNIFWRMINIFSGLNLPSNVSTVRLMTRRYVNELIRHEEREIFMAGLWFITGFDQRPQTIHKLNSSVSTYSLQRKLSLFVNSVTSFSNLPLVGIFYVGLLILLFAISYSIYLVFNWLFLSATLVGWTSVMASIWLIGGLVISFMGVIGIYLSKIFAETKQRPYTIVRRIYGLR